MLRAEPPFNHFDSPAKMLLRQVVALLGVVEDGQVLEGRAETWVVGSPIRLLDLESSQEETLGVGVLALTGAQGRQIVQAVGYAGVIGAESVFLNLKRQLQKSFSL